MTKPLTTLLIIGTMIISALSQCDNHCYAMSTPNGQCRICYNQCTDSTQASFLSCSVQQTEASDQQEISEFMCKKTCYPEDYQGLTEQPEIAGSPFVQENVAEQTQQPTEQENVPSSSQVEAENQEPSVEAENQEPEQIAVPQFTEQPTPVESEPTQILQVTTPFDQQSSPQQAPVSSQSEEPIQNSPQSEPEQGQVAITFEQLKKLKKETEGWTPPEQNILTIFCILFGSSLVFIGAFVQIWRFLDKRRKMLEFKQKHQKEWVKCFQKLNTSDTTICTVDSRDSQVLPTQPTE